MTTLLIAGATGLVGGLALAQALADERVEHVVALTRRPIPSHPKLHCVLVDFTSLPPDAPWWRVDGVISAMGTTRAVTRSPAAYRTIDRDYPFAIACNSRAHGASRFALVSSLGAHPRSRFTYTRTKGELESDLATLGFPSLTIVRPSVLAGRRDDRRYDERSALALLTLLAPVVPARIKPSPAGQVAALLLEGAISAPAGVHVKTNLDMKV